MFVDSLTNKKESRMHNTSVLYTLLSKS